MSYETNINNTLKSSNTEILNRNEYNIFSQNLLYQIAHEVNLSEQNITIDHNLIDGYRGELNEDVCGSNYVEGEPKFVNSSGADFRLQEDSPAINNGSRIDAPAVDFIGNSRPQGAGYDIGAFEYVEGSVVIDRTLKNSSLNFKYKQHDKKAAY